jgi:hypothetical protein
MVFVSSFNIFMWPLLIALIDARTEMKKIKMKRNKNSKA